MARDCFCGDKGSGISDACGTVADFIPYNHYTMDWLCGWLSKKKEQTAIQAYKPINTQDVSKAFPKTEEEINIARATPAQTIRDILKITDRIKPIELPSKTNGYISTSQLKKSSGGSTIFRKIQKSDYQRKLAQCQKTKLQFTDATFERDLSMNVKQWKRLGDILPNATFMKNQIKPNCILQGQINNCYWMSAVASLAERDYRVKNIFGALELNPYGVYMCRLTYNGVYQEVLVDDYFPVNDKGGLVYAKPYMGTDCWVLILQKCWAKLFGSYDKTNWGFNCESLYALTASPVKSYKMEAFRSQIDYYQTLFRIMQKHDEQNHVLTCSLQTKRDVLNYLSLQIGHAYSILGVFKTTYNGREIQLIQLRNPLGNSGTKDQHGDNIVEPQIPYNSSDRFWTKISAQQKKRLQYWMIQKKGDGIFYMELMQFVLIFDQVNICEINDNCHYIYEHETFQDFKPKYINLNVEHPNQKFYLLIAQPNKRRLMSDAKVRYASISVIVGEVRIGVDNKETFEYVSSKSYNHTLATNYFPADLGITKSGHYLVRIDVQNSPQDSVELTIGYSSPNDFEANFHHKIDDRRFLDTVLLDRARKVETQNKTPLRGASGWQCIESLPGCNYSYLAYRINSISDSKKYRITVDESQNQSGLFFLEDGNATTNFEHVVQRGREVIYIFMNGYLPDPELVPQVIDERQPPKPIFTPVDP